MMWHEIIMSLVIGLISGAVSSFIISIILKRRWDDAEHKKSFERDVQSFHRYLDRLKNAVRLERNQKHERVLSVFEDEPIRDAFDRITPESMKVMQEIREYLNSTRTQFENGCVFTDKEYKLIESTLFRYSTEILKLKDRG